MLLMLLADKVAEDRTGHAIATVGPAAHWYPSTRDVPSRLGADMANSTIAPHAPPFDLPVPLIGDH